MGMLILGGLIAAVLGMGLVIFSLLNLAQKGDQYRDQVHPSEDIPTPAKPRNWLAEETPSPAKRGEASAGRFELINGGALTPEP